jgi:hypothetical protein
MLPPKVIRNILLFIAAIAVAFFVGGAIAKFFIAAALTGAALGITTFVAAATGFDPVNAGAPPKRFSGIGLKLVVVAVLCAATAWFVSGVIAAAGAVTAFAAIRYYLRGAL